jgi:hypothetical protein
VAKDRLRQPFIDLSVPRNGFLAGAIAPHIVPASTPEKAPPALGELLLQIAPLH